MANSREIIGTVLSAPETYAVVLKETGRPVGSVGIMFSGQCSASVGGQEAEIGYWIGVWCGYYEGNEKSKRVQEKCGFQPHHTERDKLSPLGDYRTEHFTYLDKKAWQDNQREM